jgi:Helix-turn-helix domain
MPAGSGENWGGAPAFPPGEPSPRAASRRDRCTFGELVRERRMSIGLTQQELAVAAGVSIGALRDLEQGRTRGSGSGRSHRHHRLCYGAYLALSGSSCA